MNLILTKDVLYLLSYMGMVKAGNETRTHNSHLGRVELYQLSYTRDQIRIDECVLRIKTKNFLHVF